MLMLMLVVKVRVAMLMVLLVVVLLGVQLAAVLLQCLPQLLPLKLAHCMHCHICSDAMTNDHQGWPPRQQQVLTHEVNLGSSWQRAWAVDTLGPGTGRSNM